MAKSKKERRSSIRHMAAEDTFGVLEALQRLEQAEQRVEPDNAETDDESPEDERSE